MVYLLCTMRILSWFKCVLNLFKIGQKLKCVSCPCMCFWLIISCRLLFIQAITVVFTRTTNHPSVLWRGISCEIYYSIQPSLILHVWNNTFYTILMLQPVFKELHCSNDIDALNLLCLCPLLLSPAQSLS